MEEHDVISELYATQIKTQEEIRAETGEAAEKLRVAALNMLKSDDGKRILCAVLDQTGIFTSSFTGNSATFFLEGKRAVGLYIYRLLMTADPMALQRLITFRIEQRKGAGNG